MEEAHKLLASVEKACSEGKIPDAEKHIEKLRELSKKKSETNSLYFQAVLKTLATFRGKLPSKRVDNFLAGLKELVEMNPSDEELILNFAKALTISLQAISTKGMPSKMKEIMTELETLATKHPQNIDIQVELAIASHEITSFWRKRGEFKIMRERLKKFRELAKKYPDNEYIKVNLTKSLVIQIDSINKRDIKGANEILEEIQGLSESMPTNIGLQLEWVHAYLAAMKRTYETPDDSIKWLESMKTIAMKNKEDRFQIALAKGYLNVIASIGRQNVEALTKHLGELEKLAETEKENQEMQEIYAQSLITSLEIIGIKDYEETKRKMEELEELAREYPENEQIIKIFTDALIGVIALLAQEKRAEDILPLLEQFEKLAKKHPNNEYIQTAYNQLTEALKMIGFKKDKKKERRLDVI